MPTVHERPPDASNVVAEVARTDALLKTGALQRAIFNSANFSSIATDAKGVSQIFNVGAGRMFGDPAGARVWAEGAIDEGATCYFTVEPAPS